MRIKADQKFEKLALKDVGTQSLYLISPPPPPPQSRISQTSYLFLCYLDGRLMFYFQNQAYYFKDGVKFPNIVASASLFPPTTSLFFCNEAEINNMLNQQCWAIWLQPQTPVTRMCFHLKTQRYCCGFTSCLLGNDENDHENANI